MAIELDEFKNLMRVDGDEDDTLMQMYLDAAQRFIQTAVGADTEFFGKDTVTKLYETATYALAGSYYTYRISTSETAIMPIDATMNSIIGQLRGQYDLVMAGDLDETN